MSVFPDKFISITAMHKFTGKNDFKSVDGYIQIESNGLFAYYVKRDDGYYYLLMTSAKDITQKEN